MNNPQLTTHERHARLVKIVRRDYQKDNPGSRLFPNNSGVGWQGKAVHGAGKVELFHPRPVYYGIPEPAQKGTGTESGGTDLLGETMWELMDFTRATGEQIYIREPNIYPILTTIEIKTGKSRLKKNQKVFRDWVKSINGIYYLARECTCWENWKPVYNEKKKIVSWLIPDCVICEGKGYKLEDGE